MRDFFKSCKRKGLLIELGGEAILVIRRLTTGNRGCRRASHRNTKTYQPLPTIRPEPLGRLCRINNNSCTEYGRIPRYGHSGSPSEDDSHTILRELEKRLRVKHRIHITACHLRSAIHSKFRNLGNSIPIKQLTKGMSGTGSLLDAVQLAETLGTAGLRSEQGAIGRSTGSLTIGHSCPEVVIVYSRGSEGGGGRRGTLGSIYQQRIPHTNGAPIKKILRRLRDRGLISRRRPWPIHVACLTNVSDGDIVNWSAGIAISPLSYYRCRDNLYQVRTIVDHQIRWSAIFTPAHKHKSSARNIIPKYSKDSNRVNQEGGKTLAEFPNSIELGKLGSGQDPNNKEHSTTSLV
ncbi:hypothetical protein Sango_3042500 [Sesamum angolense]|uniref:Domain X domain-containing protein n=1 Tax=Sesamum angolense TaxID=2727404 RepID=A0AAE1VZ81_9LAMI|nr:hypothetical protein Sango_3042500 [Sesamum angolense]